MWFRQFHPITMQVASLVILLLCFHFTHGGSYIRMKTVSSGSLKYLNEHNIPVTGRNSLIFQIKGCSNALLVLSQRYNFTRPGSRYFLVILGASDGQVNAIRDSCLRSNECTRPFRKVDGKWLDCNTYKDFWLSWDNRARLIIGKGKKPLKDPAMVVVSQEPFPINFISVIGNKAHVEWGFLLDSPPVFVQPSPSGGTTIEIPESTEINKVVYDLKATDPDHDLVTFYVDGRFTQTFKCTGSSLVLTKELDYEKRHFYKLAIIANDRFNSVKTYLTVMVTDVNDEEPEIHALQPIIIPEQLSVGSIIGVVLAHDVDQSDKLAFFLRGKDSEYFKIDRQTGVLYVGKELDLDHRNKSVYFATPSVAVRDIAGHVSQKKIPIAVGDVNDNPPSFGFNITEVDVTEGHGDAVKTLLTFNVSDADNIISNVSVSLQEKVVGIELEGVSLMANTSLLDYDTMCEHAITVIILATDTLYRGRQNTATATVIVHVLPVNEHAPVWSVTSFTSAHILPNVTVRGDYPHPLTSLSATDHDAGRDGQVRYRLKQVVRGISCSSAPKVMVDAKTGDVDLNMSLKTCSASGHLKLLVEAYDLGSPSKSRDAWLTVKVLVDSSVACNPVEELPKATPAKSASKHNSTPVTMNIKDKPKSTIQHAKVTTSETPTTPIHRLGTDMTQESSTSPPNSTQEDEGDSVRLKACESRVGVLLLQSMIGVLGFCLLLTSILIAWSKKRHAYVYPKSLYCDSCPFAPATPPLITKIIKP